MNQDEIKNTVSEIIVRIKTFYQNCTEPYFVMPILGERYNSVMTALYTAALGKDRIFGVYMPNLKRKIKIEDLKTALDIAIITVPITLPMADIMNEMEDKRIPYDEDTFRVLETRLRMDIAEFIASSYNTEFLHDIDCKLYYTDDELLDMGRSLGLPDTVLCV